MFGGLNEKNLSVIRPFLEELDLEKGVTILKQGEPNTKVHFIVEGDVAVIRQSETDAACSRTITELHSGDSFGEMELIDIQNCAASVVTLTKSKVVTLSNKDLYMIKLQDLQTYTMLVLNLARDISRRLRGADEMLAKIKTKIMDAKHSSSGPVSSE